jgi:two-component system, cell cycle sensor histidine kinase and response regulator CckA
MDVSEHPAIGLADTLLVTTSDGVWIMDSDARTTFVSDRMAEILGGAPADFFGQSLREILGDQVAEGSLEALRRGEWRRSDCRLRRKDGSEIRALVATTAIRDAHGVFRGVVGTITDVTAQRKLDEQKSLILDAMTDQLTYLDPELRIHYVNRAACPHVTDEDPVGRLCYELRHGRSSPCPHCPAIQTLETRAPADVEVADSAGRVKHLRCYPVFGRDGAVVGVAELVSDVTEARRAAAALRERDGVIRAVLDASHNPVMVVRVVRDDAGQIVDFERVLANPAAEALLCCRVGARLSEGAETAFAPHLLPMYARVVTTGEPVTNEISFEGDGSPRWFIVSAVKLGDGAAVTFTEITDRKLAELEAARLAEQARQHQVTEAAARLAAGIAHDLNNLLHSVYAATGLAEGCLAPAHPARDHLRHSFTAARAAKGLVRRLTALRQGAPFHPSPLRLNRLIEDYADVLGCVAGEQTALELDLRAVRDQVPGVASELEQILLNLCLNARDAMPRGGRLTVTTEEATVGSSGEASNGSPAPAFVRLSVADTGTGMTAEVMHHLFEPLFTTKTPERGTGLGLSTVRTIVQRHAGMMEVESAEGQGTTVKVFLPSSET